MASSSSRYVPALSLRWLTPLYDPLLKWGMRETSFKQRLIQRAGVRPGHDVLDLGCGTGTLTLMMKQAVPRAHVTGLDGDPQILALAQAKAARAGLCIQWDLGLAYNLPYLGNSFDVVVSSLMVHHLTAEDKLRAFREVRRVLRPGGALHMVDFGRPTNGPTRLQGSILRKLEPVGDNLDGRLVPMLRQAGFAKASEAEPMQTIFGPIWFYDAIKPTG